MPLAQEIDFRPGQAKNLAQFPDHSPFLEGHVSPQQSHMLKALKNITGHFLPVLPGKIDVEIRGVSPVEVNKPLKVQVEFNRVHIGDPEQVCHYAVGPATASHVEKPVFPGMGNNVPVNQEVRDKLFFPDKIQFFVKPSVDVFTRFRVAVGQPFQAQLFEHPFISFPGSQVGLQVLWPAVL